MGERSDQSEALEVPGAVQGIQPTQDPKQPLEAVERRGADFTIEVRKNIRPNRSGEKRWEMDIIFNHSTWENDFDLFENLRHPEAVDALEDFCTKVRLALDALREEREITLVSKGYEVW